MFKLQTVWTLVFMERYYKMTSLFVNYPISVFLSRLADAAIRSDFKYIKRLGIVIKEVG